MPLALSALDPFTIGIGGSPARPVGFAPIAWARPEGRVVPSPVRRAHQVPADGGLSKNNNTMTKLEIKGDWNITKGVLKQKWAKLTDDDLKYVEGKHDEMVGRIQKRTGESREAVEKAIKKACTPCC